MHQPDTHPLIVRICYQVIYQHLLSFSIQNNYQNQFYYHGAQKLNKYILI